MIKTKLKWKNDFGLHARHAGRRVTIANGFEALTTVTKEEKAVNAKELLLASGYKNKISSNKCTNYLNLTSKIIPLCEI